MKRGTDTRKQMLLGIATNLVGVVVLLGQLRRIRGGHRAVRRRGATAAQRMLPWSDPRATPSLVIFD